MRKSSRVTNKNDKLYFIEVIVLVVELIMDDTFIKRLLCGISQLTAVCRARARVKENKTLRYPLPTTSPLEIRRTGCSDNAELRHPEAPWRP